VANGLTTVLVTGASGYLGGAVLRALDDLGVACVATATRSFEPCDLLDAEQVRALFARVRPRAVVHCAARVPRDTAGYADAAGAAANVTMLRNVLAQPDCRVVYISSMAVYEGHLPQPVRESSAQAPRAAYARGKWDGELALLARGRTDDLALRVPGLFGLPRRSGVLYNATRAFLTRGTFDLQAAETRWAAMHVDDAAACAARAAIIEGSHCKPGVLNVGYDGAFSLPGAVAQLATLCGVDWRPTCAQATFAMNLERLEARLGASPSTFESRLVELVNTVRGEVLAGVSGDARAC